MGGRNEETINSLRLHITESGYVHIHDDSKSLKFIEKSEIFRSQIYEAFKILRNGDGIVKITGDSKDKLCIVGDNGLIYIFVMDSKSVKKKLQDFVLFC